MLVAYFQIGRGFEKKLVQAVLVYPEIYQTETLITETVVGADCVVMPSVTIVLAAVNQNQSAPFLLSVHSRRLSACLWTRALPPVCF